MGFHFSNFGGPGESLQRFADLGGFVPEQGDEHKTFKWDSQTEWSDESWEDFVAEAVAATADAERAVAEFRANV